MEGTELTTEIDSLGHDSGGSLDFVPKKMVPNQSWSYSWEGESDDDISPESVKSLNYGCCGVVTFNFLSPLISETRERQLELIDLPEPPIFKTFEDKRDRFRAALEEISQRVDKNGEKLKNGKVIFLALRRVFWWHAVVLFFIHLIQTGIILFSPYCLGRAVDFLTSDDTPAWVGYMWVNIFIAQILFLMVTEQQVDYFKTQSLVEIKYALRSVTFDKLLKIAPDRCDKEGTGKVLNVLLGDVGTLGGIAANVYIPIIPIQFIAITALVYLEVGPSSLAMWAVILVMILASTCIVGVIMGMVKEYMILGDKRVKGITEILRGIKIFKLYSWERSLQERIEDVRKSQLDLCSKMVTLGLTLAIFFIGSTNFMLLGVFGIYIAIGKSLSLSTMMVCIVYISSLMIQFFIIAGVLMGVGHIIVALERVGGLLLDGDFQEYFREAQAEDADIFAFDNATFAWKDPNAPTEETEEAAKEETAKEATAETEGEKSPQEAESTEKESKKEEEAPFHLENINLHIKEGSLVAIVGAVASGKSALMNAMAGEMYLLEGEARKRTTEVAFVPQDHYIQNCSVRKNVVMDLGFDEQRYVRALRSAGMIEDINIFQDADKTEIGERGINLSGGQKSRIVLARALYKQADVYLLDDILSSVDPDVGDNIFKRAVLGDLKNVTRIIVMNSHLHNLQFCDRIVVVENGKIVDDGTYGDLLERYKGLMAPKTKSTNKDKNMKTEKIHLKRGGKDTTQLVADEEKEVGRVKSDVYWTYFSYMFQERYNGKCVFVMLVLLMFICNFSWWLPGVFLGFWTVNDLDSVGVKHSGKNFVITTYFILNIICIVITLFVLNFFLKKSVDGAKHVHEVALRGTLTTNLVYFDQNPVGRILNRFSGDVSAVDWGVAFSVIMCFWMGGFLLLQLVYVAFMVWFSILLILLIAYVMYRITTRFQIASTQFQRLSKISDSPLSRHTEEVVKNYGIIRVCGYREAEKVKNERIVLTALRSDWTFAMAQKWYAFRLMCWSALLQVFLVNIAIYLKTNMIFGNVAMLAFVISAGKDIGSTLSQLMQNFVNIENQFISMERLLQSRDAEPKELDYSLPLDPEPSRWPSAGAIRFEDVRFKYRDELPEVLKGVSFSIRGGEKIGICGRTGSGKSTITIALFRLYEQLAGRILIDDVDTAKLGLEALRTSMSIIPQDPVLMAADLRYNLDPTGAIRDERMLAILRQMDFPRHWSLEEDKLLGSDVSEGGSNLSKGQQQLVCIARALLQDRQIYVLDEATANIDAETDEQIQKLLRKHFEGKTVLTIAHRIDTIMDSDRVMVLSEGQLVEFDNPHQLLDDPTSEFSAFVKGIREEGETTI